MADCLLYCFILYWCCKILEYVFSAATSIMLPFVGKTKWQFHRPHNNAVNYDTKEACYSELLVDNVYNTSIKGSSSNCLKKTYMSTIWNFMFTGNAHVCKRYNFPVLLIQPIDILTLCWEICEVRHLSRHHTWNIMKHRGMYLPIDPMTDRK